jgi:hypothetical protein
MVVSRVIEFVAVNVPPAEVIRNVQEFPILRGIIPPLPAFELPVGLSSFLQEMRHIMVRNRIICRIVVFLSEGNVE